MTVRVGLESRLEWTLPLWLRGPATTSVHSSTTYNIARKSTSTNGRCADIHDLIQSSASVYQNHGLGASADMYDFVDFIKSYQSNPGTVFQQQVRGGPVPLN